MASVVDLCNRALQRLGESPITSLSDDSTRARECSRVYEFARDGELRRYIWNFSRARVSLAASSTPPAFGYDNAYPLPSDFIRLHPDNQVTDWQIEDGHILTDDEAPLNVVYIKRQTDVNKFDPLFFEALSARMALEMAERLRQPSASAMQNYMIMYRDEISAARRANAIENISRQPPEDEWVSVRK